MYSLVSLLSSIYPFLEMNLLVVINTRTCSPGAFIRQCKQFYPALLCVHQKRNVFSLALYLHIYHGSTIFLANVNYPHCFLTAYKIMSRPSILAGTLNSKNPNLYCFVLQLQVEILAPTLCPWLSWATMEPSEEELFQFLLTNLTSQSLFQQISKWQLTK